MVDHVTFAAGRMTAWYLADPQTWSFRSVAEGEALIRDHAAVLAELVGTTVFGRVTYRPYPVSHWARAHWDNAPDPQPGFAQMVERDQVHMSSSTQADKLVYYGVDLGERGTLTAALGKVVAGAAERERDALGRRLADVDRVMAGAGLAARPVSAGGYGVAAGPLVRPRAARSRCRTRTPTPARSWRPTTWTSGSRRWRGMPQPLAASTRVTTSVNTRPVTRHVVVLSLARMADIAIPEEHEPWMAATDALRLPV